MPWRDLPERFGPWKSVYNRFANWAKRGHWATIFRRATRQGRRDRLDSRWLRCSRSAGCVGRKGGSKAMLWDALEEAFRQSSTPSSTPKAARSTSRSGGPAPRNDDGRRAARASSRQGGDRGCGLRLEQISRRRAEPGNEVCEADR
ncbi:MAG: transposase [Polyangiaceae bacterium]|nr:transposase [Polyangiaceae bacterium]